MPNERKTPVGVEFCFDQFLANYYLTGLENQFDKKAEIGFLFFVYEV
jgi:hypothetical protein